MAKFKKAIILSKINILASNFFMQNVQRVYIV